MIEIEEELRARLRQRAAGAPLPADGEPWAAIHHRVARRERVRRIRRSGLTVAAVAVLTAGTVSLVGGRGGTPVATAPATGLPRLVFQVPGYPPAHVAEAGPAEGGPGGPTTGSIRLSFLMEPSRRYDGRLLFASSVAAGASFGFGELDPEARRVPIGDSTGYLRSSSRAPAATLGWQLPNGHGVYLVGVRMTDDELLSAARAASVDAAGGIVWPAAALGELAVQRTTVTPFEGRAQSQVGSAGDEHRLTLRLQAGGSEVLDNLVADRVASALEVAAASVGGVAGVYTGDDAGRGGLGSTRLIWQLRDGVVAELVADGDARRHLVEAAESLTTVSDARWRELVATTPTKAEPEPREGLNAAQATVCSGRSAWLAARMASDLTTQTRVVNALSQAFEEGERAGLGQNSDILVVITKLVDAMRAGDVATVQATPAGGCP